MDKARDTFGVALQDSPELLAVDYEATEELRGELRRCRAGSDS